MELSPFNLSEKTILITGASSGIGRAIAIACSNMGATVILTGRNKERLDETLAQMFQGNHVAHSADLTIDEERERLVSQLPKLDGLVQCAGVGSRIPCKMISTADIDHIFEPNFKAPVLLQTALLSQKKKAL